MTVFYLIGAIIICISLFFNRNKKMNYFLVGVFLLLQWVFTIYEYNHQNIVEFEYFLPDAIGILLLFTISIIAVPAFYHSYVFFSKNEDVLKNRGIYYASMAVSYTHLTLPTILRV